MTSAEQLYADTLAGYRNMGGSHQATTKSISKGYSNLLAAQEGYGDSQRAMLDRQFAQAAGQASLAASARGLGNTTIALNMQRGIASDRALAGLTLDDQMRGQKNQLAMGRLNYLAGAQQTAAGLQGQQLNYMGGVQGQAQQFWQQQQLNQGGYDNQLKQLIASRMPVPALRPTAQSYGLWQPQPQQYIQGADGRLLAMYGY